MIHLILASQSIGRKKLLEQLKVPFTVITSNINEDKIITRTPLSTLQLRAKLKGEEVAEKLQCSNAPMLQNKKLNLPHFAESDSASRGKQLTTHNQQLTTHNQQPYLILSADSGAIIDDELIGKPKNHEDAVRILKKLSGRMHEFVTAVYFINLIISNSVKNGKCGWREPSALLARTAYTVAGSTNRVASDRTHTALEVFDRSFVSFRKLTDEDIKRYLSIIDYTKYAGGYALYTGQDFITNVKGSLSNVIGLPIEKVLPIFRNNKIIPF